MSLYSIESLIILDSTGQRLLNKTFAHAAPLAVPMTKFEEELHAKTNRVNGDVIIFEDRLVVYKQSSDVIIYIIAPIDENEPMIQQVLVGFRDALELLFGTGLERQTIMDNYDKVILAVDETIDNGIILEVDPQIILSRVTAKASDENPLQNIELSEKGLRNMFDFAKGKLTSAVRQQFA